MKFILIIATLTLFVKLGRACEPPDCDRDDCGTCANSCCTLEFFLKYDTESLNRELSTLLSMGGPDLHYTFVATEDLRPYNISVHFIIQGIHTTFVQKYNDTINLTIGPLANTTSYYRSRLRAFSISQIHGAYCDDGQNYKNLIQLVKGLVCESTSMDHRFKMQHLCESEYETEYIENHIAGCMPNQVH